MMFNLLKASIKTTGNADKPSYHMTNYENGDFFLAYMSSWESPKEGDLPLCNFSKREILRETIPRH